MIHIALHLLAWLVLAAAIGAPGLFAVRRFAAAPGLSVPRALVPLAAWSLGLGLWTALLFALAALQLLRSWVLAVLVAVCITLGVAIAATRCLAPLIKRASPPATRCLAPLSQAPLSHVVRRLAQPLAWTVVAMLVAPLLVALNPTVAWDAATYHLALPDLYLAHGGFVDVPLNVYSHWPQGVQLLYALALWAGDAAGDLLGGQIVAKLMHFGFGLLVLVGLFAAAGLPDGRGRRVDRDVAQDGGHRSTVAWLAAALFLLNDVVLFELRAAYVDVAMAFYVLATFVFACAAADALDREDDRSSRLRPLLLLAGISAALLTGSKLTGVIAAGCALLPLVPSVVRALRRREPGVAASLLKPLTLHVGLPIALVGLAWAAKSWWATGNPVYPFLHDVFGGPDWSADLSRRFSTWQSAIGRGREPVDYLLLPWRVVVEGGRGYPRFDGELSLVWLAAVPVALLGLRDRTVARALAVSAAWFAVWTVSSQQMRFLIPILPLLALAAARSAAALASRLTPSARAPRLVAVLAAVVVLAAYVADHRELVTRGARHLALYFGQPTPTQAPRPEVFRRAEALPDDARLLLLGVNHVYFSPRPALADSFFEASQIADWLGDATSTHEVARRLAARGVSHIVWTNGSESIYPPSLPALLADRRFARPLFRDARHALFALEPTLSTKIVTE